MPPRRHPDAPPIEETALPSSYQGCVQYTTVPIIDFRCLLNSKNHGESEMNAMFDGVIHEVPNSYPYQYRHWRELLLAENKVDDDAGEAHVFDFSEESFRAFQHQHFAWRFAKERLAARAWDAGTRYDGLTDFVDDDVKNASPVFPWVDRSHTASWHADETSSPVNWGNYYGEHGSSSGDSDDAEEEWEDYEDSEEGFEVNNTVGSQYEPGTLDQAMTQSSTEGSDIASVGPAAEAAFLGDQSFWVNHLVRRHSPNRSPIGGRGEESA